MKRFIRNILDDFGVETENELYDKLMKDSETVPCMECGVEVPLDRIVLVAGDCYCEFCAGE